MKKKLENKSINWKDLPIQSFASVGSRFDLTTQNVGLSVLLRHLLSQEVGHISEIAEEGDIAENEDDENGTRYLTMMKKMGGRLLHKSAGDGAYQAFFILEHGLASIEYSETYLRVSALSTNEKFTRDLCKVVRKDFLPPVQQGHIFAIIRQGSQLNISSIGDASVPLVAGNYTGKVLEDYYFVIKELKSSNPSGRIVIMEGEPGTGKTHLIRAMLPEVPDAMFVLVSPEMVPSLGGPELLPLLTTYKNSYAMNGPIILVLEDADRCLVTRGGDNINSIQSLLNLGDGILGSLLDLRIVATTNAKKLEMETAILRPGRLSKRLEVGPLDFTTARGVFRRLLPNAKFPEVLADRAAVGGFRMILAEVYSQARQAGWEPDARKKKKSKKNNYLNEDCDY